MKDPDTGKRRSRLNPPEGVDPQGRARVADRAQDLWDAVKARQALMKRDTRPDKKSKEFWKLQRPRYCSRA